MAKLLRNLLALYLGSIQNARMGMMTISTSNNPEAGAAGRMDRSLLLEEEEDSIPHWSLHNLLFQ